MKSEREKMLAGELYDASDAELVAGRRRARMLSRRFNDAAEDQSEERQTVLRELFGAIGNGGLIEPNFRCDYGFNILLGDRVYMNFDCILLDCNLIRIGDDTMLAPRVQIYTAYHPIDAATRIKGPELASPISIGKRVWIGGGAIILPGVSIGDDSTIGAGSVVTKDIPSGVVAAGSPCRVLRKIE